MKPLDKIWIRSWVEKYFPNKTSSEQNARHEQKVQKKEEKRIDAILSEIIYSINLLFDLFIYENGYLFDKTGQKVRFKLSKDTWKCVHRIYMYIKKESDGNNYTEKARYYALKIKKNEWDELPGELSYLLKEVLNNASIYSELSECAMPIKYWVRFYVCGITCSKTTKKQKELIDKELKNITACINLIFDAELNEEGAVCTDDEITQLILKKNTWDRIYKIYSYIKNHTKESKEHIKRINKKEWLKVPDKLAEPVKEILNDEMMLSEIIICKKPLRKWLKVYVDETNPDVTRTSKAETHRGDESLRTQISKYNNLNSSEQRDYRRVELKKIALRLNCIFDTNLDEYGKYEDDGVKKELKVSKKTWNGIMCIYENTKRYTENEKDFFVLMKKTQWERLPESIISAVNSVLSDEEKLSEIHKAKGRTNEESSLSYGDFSNAFPSQTVADISELIKERFVNKIADIANNIRYINEVAFYAEGRMPREKLLIPEGIDIKSEKELTEYALQKLREMHLEMEEEELLEEARKRAKSFVNMQNISGKWKFVFEETNQLLDKIYENLACVSETLDEFISSNIDERTAEEFTDFATAPLIADMTDDNLI